MTIYIMNSPILTSYGQWDFEGPVTIAKARAVLSNGFISAMGHPASAAVLSQILDIAIPVQRLQITLLPGDEALVLRLTQRLPEGKVLDEAELKAIPFELGLLKRIK
jgi:hypothetical protein